MSSEILRSMQDVGLLFSSRPIAIPLIILIIAKLYFIDPSTIFYSIGLLLLTGIFSMRWCIQLIARNKLEFLTTFKKLKKINSSVK